MKKQSILVIVMSMFLIWGCKNAERKKEDRQSAETIVNKNDFHNTEQRRDIKGILSILMKQ
ncbi:hypothetical protein DBR32_12435 [Taibaiella sp. KBW10]|uniref:hypothetical protein n=1 Tax=Taibaiella sp. KBW10 TaxID=2153357 RepID=UPI000F5B3074|nr:hypothetical protein [Taibaiella sp. KBW10]RQO30371.1 hypothetical protein DBR32_12435 [Taibaiella sp. KBW10]